MERRWVRPPRLAFVNIESSIVKLELEEARAVIAAAQTGTSTRSTQPEATPQTNVCMQPGCGRTFQFPYGYHFVKGSKSLWTGSCSRVCEDILDPVSAEFRRNQSGGMTPVHQFEGEDDDVSRSTG